MAEFSEYEKAFETIRLRRSESGILEVTLHTDGGPYVWAGSGAPHKELGEAIQAISRDRDNRIVILTGTGDRFSGPKATRQGTARSDVREWEYKQSHGAQMLMDFLNIPALVISCINGPVYRHAELPFLADIVLAAEDAVIQDSSHFINRMVPGDGIFTLLMPLLGWNRARYFHLMGTEIAAPELKAIGMVNEILPREALLPRASEIAEQLIQNNPMVIRYTRAVFTAPFKAILQQQLDHAFALEALAAIDESHFR